MRYGASARSSVSDAPLPDHFVTAQDLTPAEHVRMQAAVQRYVDSAIGKTVNVPEEISFEAFQAVYLDAYRSGCKGCTTYRPERHHRLRAGGEARRAVTGSRCRGCAAAWCGHD